MQEISRAGTYLAQQIVRGRPAVAVHFFHDFILKMFTVVGLQASIKTNACFYGYCLSYLVGIFKC